MSTLEPLIPVAVVGTARRELDAVSLPASLGPAECAGRTAADALLAMAARAALIDKVSLPAVAAPAFVEPVAETLPAPTSAEFVGALQHALDGAGSVVAEALSLLAERGRRLPPGALQGVLEAAVVRRDLRPLLPPVLGARGEWLVRLNPRWRFDELLAPDPDDEELWHHGTRAERLAWLTAVRRTDPDRARELLAAGFADEDAPTRTAQLAALRTGLGPADERFLEVALDDRGREVRAVARGLLAGLAESAYVHRMRARLAARINPRRGARWRVDLTGLDADDWRDGVGTNEGAGPPSGKQAAEVYAAAAVRAMVAGVPLSTWAEDFGYPAVDLARIRAGSTELGPLPGLRDAALREENGQVAAAILARPDWGSDPDLVRCLNLEQREAILPARVRARGPVESVAELQAAPFGQNTASVLLNWLLENRSAGRRGSILAVLGTRGPIASDPVWDLASLLRRLAGRLIGADQNRAFQAATTVNLRRALAAAVE